LKPPLYILHLEDEPIDAALVLRTLEAEGVACAITRVRSRGEFIAVLEQGLIELILLDFSLPGFDGSAALEIARTRWPLIPVIIVSATLGEERAIDLLKNGATDYVLKDRLARLAPSVRRAMREVEERRERQRLEAQFVEAQKMEVIGQLASGVAHDFNNILAVIMGCGEWIASELAVGSPLKKYTDEIRHASERAAGLTQQLLVFSRKEKVKCVVLDLNDVVNDLDQMLRRLIDENIQLTIAPGQDTGRINADCGYVGQVVLNLVVNARDAMPHGGRLTLTTGNVAWDNDQSLASRSAISGNYVMLSVNDTGSGMTDEVKARLFEPFFTTKPSGKGTGLGLATCVTIVHQCGGHITVSSELGKGSTFKVYFPRVDQPLSAKSKAVHSEILRGGTETLLIVEDEPSVRNLACAALKAQGYDVLFAANGQEALHVAREHKGPPISLVVTDVIMPVMGGKVMAEWLKITYPDLKVVFTSGYVDEVIGQQNLFNPDVAFLPKPYTPGTLARKVREMLDQETQCASGRERKIEFDEAKCSASDEK
jgi:two-component system, cell cycle sensor histidine kinase and response regulator CckA